MKKILIILSVIGVILLAAVIGNYAVQIGAFLIKVLIGIAIIVVFLAGFFIGRFFPYKKKEKNKEETNTSEQQDKKPAN